MDKKPIQNLNRVKTSFSDDCLEIIYIKKNVKDETIRLFGDIFIYN